MLIVPFFRELLKNIEFSLNDKDLLKKIQYFTSHEIPKQVDTIDRIDRNRASITNCYYRMKETMNKINSFSDRKEVDENLLKMTGLIEDYRLLCLYFFEKLVAWKLKNEFFTEFLFEGK